MKKLISLLLCLSLLALCGCGSQPQEPEQKKQNDKISVVTTLFPCYDFLREIAGDKVDLKMLLPFGGESHTYEPTLQDMIAVSECDIFISVGGDIDPWAEELWKASVNSEQKSISLLEIAGEEHHHKEGEEHHDDTDGHVWTSPKRVMKIVKFISEALCDSDPKNTEVYSRNRAEYLEKLNLLSGELEALGGKYSDKTLVFADRFPFSYLCLDYGFRHLSALPGCSSDSEPTITAVNNLITRVKEEKTPAVLYTETADETIAKTVMNATGCGGRQLHSCHSVSEDQFLEGESYLSLMNKNLEVLKEVLE